MSLQKLTARNRPLRIRIALPLHSAKQASIPFNDRSLEMLQYLSIEQALADHATVVEHIQSGLANRRVVINVGGSCEPTRARRPART